MKNLQRTAAILILLALPWATGCFTVAGGLVGGTIGGGAGFVGGACTGHPVQGATIGATGGALIGGGAGAVVDTVITAPFRIPGAIADAVRPKPGLSVDDVIRMNESGVATDMIIRQIEAEGMRKRPTSQELIQLAQNNVSQEIVIAMQSNITSEIGPSQLNDIQTSDHYDPQQTQEQFELDHSQLLLPLEDPSNQPDMTPAVAGGAFGPPNEGVPGFTPRSLSGFTPSGAEGGQWNLDDVPRTPGGARINPHPQGRIPPVPNITIPPADPPKLDYPTRNPAETPVSSPPELAAYGMTDTSSETVDQDSVWRR